MKNKKMITFEIIMFLYFLIGVICGILLETGIGLVKDWNPFITFYLYTITPVFIIYLIFGCILCKHRTILMNIIDSILCIILIMFQPYPIFIHIYAFNKYLYYFLGGCFSCLPLIFCIIDKQKIQTIHFLKTITRILMIMFMVLLILFIKSCGADL